MKRLLLVTFLLAVTLDAAPPDYFLSQLATARSRHFARPDAFVDAGHLHDAAYAAAAEVRAFQLTGNKAFALSAVDRMRAIAAFLNTGQESSFFVPYPFTWTYRALNEANLLDAPLKDQIRQGVAKNFRARDLTAIHNQTLQRATGLALAAQTWPDLPQAKSWKDYADTIQKMQASFEDVSENSTNYNALDVLFTFYLADVTNHPELIRSRGIRAMYTRFRDQVSPSGFISPYGDAGDFAQPYNPDWPIHNPWAMYVTAFERAAREYSDPTFLWASRRVAKSGMAHQPLDRAYGSIIDLFYLSFASAKQTQSPPAPAIRSAILTRADPEGPAQKDKLILAPSREPGAPFVMADLYVRGPHAHENQHGAITYFEYRDTPLLTSLGYNNRAPEQASLVMMRPAGDPFPAVPGIYPANEWRESMLPTSRLPVIDPSKPFQRRIDSLTVRVESTSGVTAWASDFRLAGKTTIVLNAGNPAEAWDVPKGIQMQNRTAHAEFDCREYPTLAFRWKLSSNRQQARPIILRVISGTLNTDYHAEVIQLQPTLDRADVEQRRSDQYGVMEYSSWITPDTTLRRQMLLTSRGVLIVRDRLVPGPLAKGMAGGPIWQMVSEQKLKAVLSASGDKPEYGEQTTDIWSKKNQKTRFAKQTLEPGKPAYFVSVLDPNSQSIEIRNEPKAAIIQVGDATIRVSEDGTWTVTDGRTTQK